MSVPAVPIVPLGTPPMERSQVGQVFDIAGMRISLKWRPFLVRKI